jgi:Helicase associated domain
MSLVSRDASWPTRPTPRNHPRTADQGYGGCHTATAPTMGSPTTDRERFHRTGSQDPQRTGFGRSIDGCCQVRNRAAVLHSVVEELNHMENGFGLGQWVGRQRQSKQTLSEARRQQLDEVGFVWNPHEADWEEGLHHLITYKEREGHCRVPFNHMEDGFRLGQWVRVQRRNADTLSAPRRQQLDELGFVWDQLETNWAEGLRYLTIYKEREGHCRVPRNHMENGFRLGQWVGRQRQSKDQETLTEARRQQLDELGFVWDRMKRIGGRPPPSDNIQAARGSLSRSGET